MTKRINSDDLRNSREPYWIPLTYEGEIDTTTLKCHIDSYTRHFKHWHLDTITLFDIAPHVVQFKHSNGSIHFIMKVKFDDNHLVVSCDCDRKVEMLCHHSYRALKELINKKGEDVFRNYLHKSLQVN
ncbi:hypothetical protein SAMN05421788_113122 [Filimonas lacunae]|uniref:SWIM-type domain-containing protein n=1 Tax=Filimonas lacunae TaxID=477680 RepID=A0A1N7RF66_9BACT|nr:hypothetical protein SAMN05421788_113122 [Filimonas lacunae]